MKRAHIVAGALLLFLLLLIVFAPRLGWSIASFLAGRGAAFPEEALRAEIVALKTELAKYTRTDSLPSTPEGREVFVYSRYPFNFKDSFTISEGAREGLEEGSVIVRDGIVLGVVDRVFQDTARVVTLFAPTFRAPVRIGTRAVDALLVGGVEPRLTLIPEHARVEAGDTVYTAFEGAPYGLPIGEVFGLRLSPDQAFLEAGLRLPYNIEETKEVVVLPLLQ